MEAGGIHVDTAFKQFIRAKLNAQSHHPNFDLLIAEAVNSFETDAKRTFGADDRSSYIVRVGSVVPEMETVGIKEGAISLDP